VVCERARLSVGGLRKRREGKVLGWTFEGSMDMPILDDDEVFYDLFRKIGWFR
jgi:hypothetical protein